MSKARTISLHLALSESDYLLLGHEAVRRRSSKKNVLLSLAEAGGLAELRKKAPADQ